MKYLNILKYTHNFLRITRMLKWNNFFKVSDDVIDFVKDLKNTFDNFSQYEKTQYRSNLAAFKESYETFWKKFLIKN